jgi:sugar lactone lactonase YvrE
MASLLSGEKDKRSFSIPSLEIFISSTFVATRFHSLCQLTALIKMDFYPLKEGAHMQKASIQLRTKSLRLLMALTISLAITPIVMGETKGSIISIAGNGTRRYAGDRDLAVKAELVTTAAVTVDSTGNIYIADMANNRVRKIAAKTGVISTLAGTGKRGYSGDGGPATSAELNYPQGVTTYRKGNVYIADTDNNRVRKVTVSTGVITTVAGSGAQGYAGDGGPATSAALNWPCGVAVARSGDLYFSDYNNHRIRKVTVSTGKLSTVAGTGKPGYSGDGRPATSAQLNDPSDVTLDAKGNVYIADTNNQRIRKVSASTGAISTIAGNGKKGFSGDGGLAISAEFNSPNALTLDASGNLYIADTSNHRIRKLTVSTGTISTLAGNGRAGYSGDGGPAASSELNSPWDVAIDPSGNILIADFGNDRFRKVIATGSQTTKTQRRKHNG